MHDISLRPASSGDAEFALHVTEACVRFYAEQSYGIWIGRPDLDLAFDQIIRLTGSDIGLIGVERRPDHWFLGKLYLLPAYQNQGIGSWLLQRLMREASSAATPVRLTVRFYERHGSVLTHTIPPRHHMEWRGH